jgi:hypothetical protein
MSNAITDRYRCAEQFVRTSSAAPLSAESSYFRFGRDLICYGRSCPVTSAASSDDPLANLLDEVRPGKTELQLPFDLTELVENLTHERYPARSNGVATRMGPNPLLKKAYYAVRGILPAPLRIPLQRIYFRGWDKITFPSWPLDTSVETLLETVLVLSMKSRGIDSVPFIWFWPDGASSATMLTHDVETEQGRDFCPRLMDLNESFGFSAAFQIVPEERYEVTPAFLGEIRGRGHEINVHDHNHDGNLFSDRRHFLKRIQAVNEYGRSWGAKGFRSAILYRNLDWYDALEFDYDMSVPNVGHLEAQRGGCCTALPYFVGDILELPVTTTQDYSLFQILRQHDIELWKTQAKLVLQKHGLLTFLTHPDYLIEKRAQDTYRKLLGFLSELQSKQKTWIALPRQVNQWWRQRSKMSLVPDGDGWRIEGEGKERARVAYARLDGKHLVYVPHTTGSLASRGR